MPVRILLRAQGHKFSLPSLEKGVAAIVAEVEAAVAKGDGTDVDLDNLDYILHKAAGSSDYESPHTGGHRRDCDKQGSLLPARQRDGRGKQLDDFIREAQAFISKRELADAVDASSPIQAAHVLALRLYTTSTYQLLNGQLRKNASGDTDPIARLIT